MSPSPLITVTELAERLHIAKGTCYQWVYLKRIPYVKVGRCLRFDFEEVSRTLRRYNGKGWPEGRRG